MKKEHKDMLPEYKPIKTRGAMYVLSPFIFYVIGVIIVELLLSLAFFLFSLAASSLGNSLLLSVDAFLYRNEEMLIPAISGIIKIPHFLKDFYREDWEIRVELDKARTGQYVFNMDEAKLWKGRGSIGKSFSSLQKPALIILLSVLACICFNLLTGQIMEFMHMAYQKVSLISDVGGVGGPGSAVDITGGHSTTENINLIVLVFSTVIAAPFIEELVFRGIIFQRMRDNHGFLSSAVLSSAAFGVIHLNMTQFIFGFMMGILFSLIYERYHRLSASILAHMSANLFNLVLMIPAVSAFSGEVTGTEAGSLILIAVSGIVMILAAAVLVRKIEKKDYVVYSHIAGPDLGGES